MKILLSLLILLLYSGCTYMHIDKFIPTKSNLFNCNIKKNVDSFALPLLNRNNNIGLVVGTFYKNKTNFFTYGYANNENKIPMHKDTLFALGSNTKILIKSLILILEEKGLVNLDETIGNILPTSIQYKDNNVKNITLKELILHSSGLEREPRDLATLKAMLKYFFTGDNIYAHIDTHYMYNYLSNIKIDKLKNNEASYSNIGIGILAYTITIKMKQPLDTLLNTYLFRPLNMNNTTLQLSAKNNQNLAIGYVGEYPIFMKRNTPLKNWIFPNMMLGTGGGYSTAPDLIKLTKAHLQLSNTHLDNILKKSYKSYTYDNALYYTLGWQVKYIKEYDTYIHYKYGVIAGFSCYIGIHIATKSAIVVLKNNFNWEDSIGHNLLLRMALAK